MFNCNLISLVVLIRTSWSVGERVVASWRKMCKVWVNQVQFLLFYVGFQFSIIFILCWKLPKVTCAPDPINHIAKENLLRYVVSVIVCSNNVQTVCLYNRIYLSRYIVYILKLYIFTLVTSIFTAGIICFIFRRFCIVDFILRYTE